MPKWIGGVFGNPIATTDPISGQKGIFNISDRIYFNEQILQGTGGYISTPGDGYIYHTFISPGTFSINGTGQIEIVAIGGGGGGGGYRAPEPGGGGGAGGIVTALFTLSKASYSVLVGLGGDFGSPENLDGVSGITGGGGQGGDGFPYGSGGGGGGAGGGWSGLRTPTIYYVVAGGGAGGGGSPTANNTAAKGGGVGPFSLVTLRGASGNPSSSGGYGGAGSGFDGSTGGGGNGGTSPISGGSNYANPIGIVSLTDTFSSYTGPNGQANGSARGTRDPSFSTHPMSPAVPTNAGYGGFGGTEIYWTPNSNGIDGIVILRYAENSITDSIDYLK